MSPELREFLEDTREHAHDRANNPQHPIMTRYRKGANLRTQFESITGHAGLKAWPKLFQNLRSNREIEFAESFNLCRLPLDRQKRCGREKAPTCE